MRIDFPSNIYEGNNVIHFKQPFYVDWLTPLDENNIAHISFDSGMSCELEIDPLKDFLFGMYDTNEIIIRKIKEMISFDLFHAFFHCTEDPNFTYYHWALYGLLKDRVECKEEEEFDGHDVCEDEKPM